MTLQYGLSEKHWELLKKILVKPLEGVGAKVWIFGSRARGDYREFSDIDLLIENLKDRHFLSELAEKIEESHLPVRVDLVLIEDLAESYRAQVMKDRRLVRQARRSI